MSKVTLAENIYWVGAVDWNIRDFHGYTMSWASKSQPKSTFNFPLRLIRN